MKKIKKWNVTIEATVRKTLTVEGKNEEEAIENAYQYFSVTNDEIPEKYEENVIDVVKC